MLQLNFRSCEWTDLRLYSYSASLDAELPLGTTAENLVLKLRLSTLPKRGTLKLRTRALQMRVQRNNAVSNNMIRMRKEIPTRKCIECGRVFKLYLDHPNVLHCSKECIENNAAKLESK